MSKIAIFFALILITACTREPLANERTISLTYARSLVGLDERQDTVQLARLMGVNPVRTEWCAAFVNAILNRQGIPGSESVSSYPLTARSFLDWGQEVDIPKYGDVVVFPRGNQGWQGHVGFYVGM